MSPRRILMVSIYPIARPQYGGPKRSRAIYDTLRAHFDAVACIAVYPRHGGVKAGPNDIAVSTHTQDQIDRHPYLADLICGEAIYSDAAVKRRVAAFIRRFGPDTILIEQVYPYFGLRYLLSELNIRARLVFSSQNIEYRMKPSMYEFFGAGPETVNDLAQRIRQAEDELAVRSSLVVAVSQQDLNALRDMGARQWVLAPNGTSPLHASQRALQRHARLLARRGVHASLVFVSSAHQPNWQGFIDMVGTKVGFLPHGVCLLLCGSVCNLIGPRIASANAENATFWQRAMTLGELPEDDLAAAILSADLLLLPSTQGGGTNLKTAEALVSGRPIVATSFGFRGYEEYQSFPGVRVADTPIGFREAIIDSLEQPVEPRSADQTEMIRRLYWEERLASLVEGVRAL